MTRYIVEQTIVFRGKLRDHTIAQFREAPDYQPHEFETYQEAADAAERLYRRQPIYWLNGATDRYYTVRKVTES